MFRKLIATAMLSILGVTGVGVVAAASASATDYGGYDMLFRPPLTTDGSVQYYVGETGYVRFHNPVCDNGPFGGYGMIASDSWCTHGYADVYQRSNYPVYKDVNVWKNGVLVKTDRFVVNCSWSTDMCGANNSQTMWSRPGITGWSGNSFWYPYTAGANYFQTTVWFWENGSWLKKTLTTHF